MLASGQRHPLTLGDSVPPDFRTVQLVRVAGASPRHKPGGARGGADPQLLVELLEDLAEGHEIDVQVPTRADGRKETTPKVLRSGMRLDAAIKVEECMHGMRCAMVFTLLCFPEAPHSE